MKTATEFSVERGTADLNEAKRVLKHLERYLSSLSYATPRAGLLETKAAAEAVSEAKHAVALAEGRLIMGRKAQLLAEAKEGPLVEDEVG